ncbi:DUF4215 domain-containing protein [Candidatus Parcubacteria bacterium]|nr:MAG: DUF4215 domain-containing protein [Candidatus Parcubacteria bacterium]
MKVDNDIESTSGRSLDCSSSSCESSFTSGDVVDVEDPSVEITYPDNGDNISVDSSILVQVSATDDSEVSTADFYGADELFDSVAASGDDLSDVVIETTWYTDGLDEDTKYNIQVIVEDIAGNSDTDSIKIKTEAAHCSNGEQDEDEEGEDCGGDDCGACSGAACEEDSDCASGICEDNVCVAYPEITNISPADGAVGTYVTISGESFGSSGSVYFTDENGDNIEAEIPDCADWSDEEIVVAVPEGAVSGPISVINDDGYSDATNDDNGALIDDFEVNDTQRPSLCSLSDNTGYIGDALTLSGANFGDDRNDSSVNFDDSEAGSYTSWSDDSISVTVPSVSENEYHDVSVTVDGVESNSLSYGVKADNSEAPSISYLSPEEGGVGQYITIYGTNFGDDTGIVYLQNNDSGYTAVGSADFPDQCDTDFWSDDEITIIIPDEYTNGNSLDTGSYTLYIESSDGVQSEGIDFTVNNDDPTPGICKLDPDSGASGDEVTIYGERLGSSEGEVTFYNDVSASISNWSNDEITVNVPDGVSTGPITVTSAAGDDSNTLNFAVSDDVETETETLAGGYGWYFSTGSIPEVPEIVEGCDYDTDIISAVPNDKYVDEACTVATVYAEFTTLMNTSTLNTDNITVAECSDSTCDSVEVIEGGTIETSSSTDRTAFIWLWPTNTDGYNGGIGFKENTTYLVTVSADVESEDGANMEDDVQWTFTTGGTDADCDIEAVVISPSEETLESEGATTEFQALASGNCQVYSGATYTWNWELDPTSYANITAGECSNVDNDSCAVATALNEGESTVYAEETDSGVTGDATLVVDYTDPYVTDYWPDCSSACVNASIGVDFNIAMDSDVTDDFSLYSCANELCLNLTEVSITATCTETEMDSSGGVACKEVEIIPNDDLGANTYYRVILSGDAVSASGVPLTATNYGEDFSWTFKTKDDDTLCSVNRIDLSPSQVTLDAVGDTQQYTVIAYGETDNCSVAGQKLNSYDYDWDWIKPYDDENVAAIRRLGASYADSDPESIADGCNSVCLPSGSEGYDAVCGNGIIEDGEECDDSNTTNGDGCSSVCLREGANGSYGTCGDGIVDQDTNGAGEDCDDGNTIDGDGCSSSCLREGSDSVGATCGNGSIARDENGAGEDCDDSNQKNGDGCSSQCLYEGSTSQSELDAVCGDGEITSPYETCDDGNTTDGDGCSSSCLREGSYGSYGTCGNGVVERIPSSAGIDNSGGEDCDGGEGCQDDCTYSGSSMEYRIPSVCGDGKAGTGELAACEIGASGDGNIDPVQQAIILDSAPKYVDEDTQLAQTTIEVDYDDVYDTASLSLECSATDDYDCRRGYGPADNMCCMARPEVESVSPNGEDECLNSAIYAVFSTKMDLDTFVYEDGGEDVNNVYIRYEGSSCPSGYNTYGYTSGFFNKGFAANIINKIKSIFGVKARAQSAGDCLLPISDITQTQQSDGTYKVAFKYSDALEADSVYTIYIKGGTVGDDDKDGVLSVNGVEMDGDYSVKFKTGSSLCTLDVVEVEDTSEDSVGVFTMEGEEHEFTATPYSYQNGTKDEIQSLEGIYAWQWTEWKTDNKDVVDSLSEDNSSDVAESVYSAMGDSGDANVGATATITDDILGGTVGDNVSGSMAVTAIICENTWPDIEDFPFIDDPSGTVDGIEKGVGWMNFSMYYCRDYGEDNDTSDDLGELSVTASNSNGPSGLIKEYFFSVEENGEDSGDVIGIRIFKNEDYLSPLLWYQSQGFGGNPESTEVGNLPAVRDGRSVYVAVPNESGGVLYPNIFVISYNEGASEETKNIFEQLLENISFNTNLDDTNLCLDSGSYTDTVCDTDLDCSSGETCADEVGKIQRDMRRLLDMKTIATVIDGYQADNDGYTPALESGTYVAPISASMWPSWSDILPSLLGTSIPSDPINEYSDCSSEDYDFDSDTCVDHTRGAYMCPEGSYIYHYRAFGEDGYYLTSELEYNDASWYADIDDDTSDNEYIVVGAGSGASAKGFSSTPAFCDGSVYGVSTTCGDGIVGGSEVCEIGDTDSELCDYDGDGVADDGTITTKCNSSCSGYEEDSDAVCSPFECGNGIVEDGEECDDGSFNGEYGYCGSDCTYDSSFYCGDGTVAGNEVCDCGSDTVSYYDTGYGGEECVGVNGTYDYTAAGTCAWDCSGPASYCGDGVVDSGEECDGNTNTWSGKLCFSLSVLGGGGSADPCESDSDCDSGQCGDPTGYLSAFDECPKTTVCITADDENDVGIACESDSDCGAVNGQCSNTEYQTTRTRTCADDSASGDMCEWEQNSWRSITCKAQLGNCGDGVVDDDEECDDGNSDNTDSCTNECTLNVCGDGYVYEGEEQCDEGELNGVACDSEYDSTCTYCSDTCIKVTNSGDYCGDGEINGDELCDGSQVPYYYYNVDLGINGTCDSEDAGEVSVDDDGNEYTCTQVGICNGGDENGEYCTDSDKCGGYECVTPACADDCNSVCPFSYSSDAIMMKSNLVSAKQKSSVTLSSYSETLGSASLSYGNSATMYLPACTAATGLTADIEFNFDSPTPYVIFLSDLSSSMNNEMDSGKTRLEALQEVLSDSIETLFDEVQNIKIALVGMTSSSYGAEGYESDTLTEDDAQVSEFTSSSGEADLLSEVDNYDKITGGGTYTMSGLEVARDMFTYISDDDTRKIAVLLTDGNWDDTTASDGGDAIPEAEKNPAFSACKLKEAGVEVFTIILGRDGSTTISSDMSDCEQFEGYDSYEDYYEDYYASLAEEACGNGVVDSDYGEECDDGNSDNTDSCTNDCKLAVCGDGYVQPSNDEECDDAGESATCDSDCTAVECGDETTNTTAGEDCDPPGSAVSTDLICDSDCTVTTSSDFGGTTDDTSSETLSPGAYNPWILKYKNALLDFENKIFATLSGLKQVWAADCNDGPDELSLIEQAACWSSGNPDSENGVDYAYNSKDEDDLAAAYEQIVETLVGATITYVVDGETVVAPISEGYNVNLPWPEGFECDGENETEIPFRVSFEGDGTIEISDVKFKYCEP